MASLRNGKSKSCGFCKRDYRPRPDRLKHGMDGTPTYRSWIEMRRRCRVTHRAEFKDYGGRGITVCDEWQDFGTFFRDMGERPAGHSIDRVDNERGYSKENCVWAPLKAQARNKRTNRILQYKGQRMTLAEAAERAGISQALLSNRLKRGWAVDESMETAPLPQGRYRYPGKPGPKPQSAS